MKILFCIIIVFFLFSTSFACSCVVNLPDEEQLKYLKKLDTIFYGEVISIREKRIVVRRDRTEKVKPIVFKVLRIWKGIKTQEITVEANAHDSCQVNIKVGQKHLIYAGKWQESDVLNYIDYCSFERFDKKALEKFYGAGEVIEGKNQSSKQSEDSKSFLSIIWTKILSFFS